MCYETKFRSGLDRWLRKPSNSTDWPMERQAMMIRSTVRQQTNWLPIRLSVVRRRPSHNGTKKHIIQLTNISLSTQFPDKSRKVPCIPLICLTFSDIFQVEEISVGNLARPTTKLPTWSRVTGQTLPGLA